MSQHRSQHRSQHQIRRIYLDLDDVCNTLAPHLLHCVGCAVDPRDYRQVPPQFGYEIHRSANHLLGYERFTDNAHFWRHVTRTHWAECPQSRLFPWVLLRVARLVGRENVCLATSPTECPESLAGKLDWIQQHMPAWMHRQYAITPCKWRFARPDSLLIDDLEANCVRFRLEGGHVILVPAPWNRLWPEDLFHAVDRQLVTFF